MIAPASIVPLKDQARDAVLFAKSSEKLRARIRNTQAAMEETRLPVKDISRSIIADFSHQRRGHSISGAYPTTQERRGHVRRFSGIGSDVAGHMGCHTKGYFQPVWR